MWNTRLPRLLSLLVSALLALSVPLSGSDLALASTPAPHGQSALSIGALRGSRLAPRTATTAAGSAARTGSPGRDPADIWHWSPADVRAEVAVQQKLIGWESGHLKELRRDGQLLQLARDALAFTAALRARRAELRQQAADAVQQVLRIADQPVQVMRFWRTLLSALDIRHAVPRTPWVPPGTEVVGLLDQWLSRNQRNRAVVERADAALNAAREAALLFAWEDQAAAAPDVAFTARAAQLSAWLGLPADPAAQLDYTLRVFGWFQRRGMTSRDPGDLTALNAAADRALDPRTDPATIAAARAQVSRLSNALWHAWAAGNADAVHPLEDRLAAAQARLDAKVARSAAKRAPVTPAARGSVQATVQAMLAALDAADALPALPDLDTLTAYVAAAGPVGRPLADAQQQAGHRAAFASLLRQLAAVQRELAALNARVPMGPLTRAEQRQHDALAAQQRVLQSAISRWRMTGPDAAPVPPPSSITTREPVIDPKTGKPIPGQYTEVTVPVDNTAPPMPGT
ncbi:MAG: hypothetical protein JO242_12505, partial [Streptosporangiaceae bacterium]|nr:hypothetical protein [Streptosporangiaceae bacterium]